MNLILLYIILFLIIIALLRYVHKKFLKYKKIYLKNGLDGSYYYFINKNFKKKGLNNFFDKKRRDFVNQLSKITNQRIYSGPYKNVKILNINQVYDVDLVSILLGTYELQIQNKIIELSKKYNLKYFIDLGAGEGFHIISLLKKKYFKEGFAFEINEKSRIYINKNSILNGVKKKIKIYGEANFLILRNILKKKEMKKILFLIDIEGNEYNLINENFCKQFKNCHFIIEDHNFNVLQKKKKKRFYYLIKKYFSVNILNDSGKDPFKLDILKNYSDDEKYLMMSEGRPKSMQWLVLKPKNYK